MYVYVGIKVLYIIMFSKHEFHGNQGIETRTWRKVHTFF